MSLRRTRRERALAALVALGAVGASSMVDAAITSVSAQAPAPGGNAPTETPPPEAERSVPGEVLIILATETVGSIDPALESMPALRQPPFSAFRGLRLLARPTIRVTIGRPVQVPLPNGRVLQLIVSDVTPEGRHRVRVSINRPDQNDYLPLLEIVAPAGDPFFVAGQSFMGGTLVIGVRLGERPTRTP